MNGLSECIEQIDEGLIHDIKVMTADLKVFYHHIYEYKKGLRFLILTTEKRQYLKHIEARLSKMNIDYLISSAGNSKDKINIFFGDKSCIKVLQEFGDCIENLNILSPEQDFILGSMLGYCRKQQCERYIKLKNNIL